MRLSISIKELERLEQNGVVDLKWWLGEPLVVSGKNAAGGSALLLKASQINIQTELQRQGEILIFRSATGCVQEAEWGRGGGSEFCRQHLLNEHKRLQNVR